MFEKLTTAFSSVIKKFSHTRSIAPADLQEGVTLISNALLDADVPLSVVKEFTVKLSNEVLGRQMTQKQRGSDQLLSLLKRTILQFLSHAEQKFELTFPARIMVCGLQGSGKTTSITKLAARLKKEFPKKKIILASVDFYRPAAVEQLRIGAEQTGVLFYQAQSSKVLTAAQEIIDHAKNANCDILIIDTAGRMHVDSSLLIELKSIKEIVQPTKTVLVLDAMMGQESIEVAKNFDEAVQISGALISKTDSDARGGILFVFSYIIKKPIFFLGSGEHINDLKPFFAARAAEQMLGMGDIAGFVEEAETRLNTTEQKRKIEEERLRSGVFTLADFAAQLGTLQQFGSLSRVLNYLPRQMVGTVSEDQLREKERLMKKYLAIINSMTKQEREQVSLLNSSRKQRIARGAGVSVQDIDKLLAQFKEMQGFVKLFGKFGKNF